MQRGIVINHAAHPGFETLRNNLQEKEFARKRSTKTSSEPVVQSARELKGIVAAARSRGAARRPSLPVCPATSGFGWSLVLAGAEHQCKWSIRVLRADAEYRRGIALEHVMSGTPRPSPH